MVRPYCLVNQSESLYAKFLILLQLTMASCSSSADAGGDVENEDLDGEVLNIRTMISTLDEDLSVLDEKIEDLQSQKRHLINQVCSHKSPRRLIFYCLVFEKGS